MKRVLDALNAQGMVAVLGYFYFGQDQHLKDEAAVIRATDLATRWVLEGGWRNVLIEVNTIGHWKWRQPACARRPGSTRQG